MFSLRKHLTLFILFFQQKLSNLCWIFFKKVTAWPFQSTATSKEDTARKTTFSLTKTNSNLPVSYTTEGHAFSADFNDNDVTKMIYLPTEIDMFRNDLFNHLVKILGSLLGLLVIILTTLFIYFIYLKYFQKTTNEGEINDYQMEQIFNL